MFPRPIEIATGLALAAAIFLLAVYDARAAEVYSVTRTGPGSFVALYGETGSADARVIQVPAPVEDDATGDRARRWAAYCQPRGRVDRYGVERLSYAKPGCEFGRDHD